VCYSRASVSGVLIDWAIEMQMKTKLWFFSVCIAAVFTLPARAQTGSGKTPETSTDVGKSAKWDDLTHHAKSGDYLVGNVIVTGGELPWEPVPITVTCNGKIRYTATASPKGNFEIAAVENTSHPTLGTDGSVPAAQFFGCTVEATLAGFTSSVLTIANRSLLDNPDIGTVKLSREEGAAGSAVSSTTASAPKDAAKAFEKARSEWLEQKPERAQHDLEKAVQVYPQFAEAWYQLGKIQEASHSPEAQSSFSKAAAADPRFSLPYAYLIANAALAGKWEEVANDTSHELELYPRGTPQVFYFNALANYKLGKKDVAELNATKSLAMDPLHTQPNTEQLLAVILADKRDYAGALEHLRNCLTYLPAGPNSELVKQQVAQLEKMAPPAK
jgi:tetratricopeptide (TPR) repeat protein